MSENSTGKMRDRTNLKRLDDLTDEEIERAAHSDADTLLLEEYDMASLEVVVPEGKQTTSLRVDPDVLAYFRSFGKGYQTRMNAAAYLYAGSAAPKTGLRCRLSQRLMESIPSAGLWRPDHLGAYEPALRHISTMLVTRTRVFVSRLPGFHSVLSRLRATRLCQKAGD